GAGQRGDRTRAHVLAGALACRHRTRGPDDSVPQQDVSGILRAPSSVLTSLSDRDGRMSCSSTTYQVRVGDQPQGRKGAGHRDASQRARPRRRGDRMTRRDFIAMLGEAAVWPLAARAQAGKLVRLGYLEGGARADPTTQNLRRQFVLGMRDLGYNEGRDYL